MVGACGMCLGKETRGAYSLVGKPEGKRPSRRRRGRMADNIKMYI